MTKSIELWKMISKNCSSDKQKMYYEKRIEDAFECYCVRLSDVFTKEEIKKIKDYVQPKQKMCYMNAYRMTSLFPDRVKYVEGEVTLMKSFGIEHAWNLIDDRYYVDVTMELALNSSELCEQEYTGLGKYNVETIEKIANETGVYGGVYNFIEFGRLL